MRAIVIAILTITALTLLAPNWPTIQAGEYNPVLKIGDPAPAWRNLPGVDGQRHALDDLKDKDAVVVIFTCNSCPVAVDYEDRNIALAKKFGGAAGRVAFVAINVNKVPDDSLPKMTERAQAKQLPFPFLFDETQQIARDYGATFTPEYFLLDRQRKIAFMGGLDDHSDPAQVKHHYLADAIEAVLRGASPMPAEALARGCLIRYDRRPRRTRE